MWQLLKRSLLVLLLAAGAQSAWAFSLLGNFDDWQVNQLAYQTGFIGFNDGPVNYGDVPVGGPMNLGEEFRWNIPIINYAFDQNFLDYFGSNGVYAIEEAIAILNNVSNISSYSSALNEVPLEATRLNFRASALGLLDLKSAALHYLVEKMGLADPVRYTWTLRRRAPLPAGCPFFDYLVIKRNFDPVTWEPSSYVNGVLYTYRIVEFCPVVDQAEAFEHRVDPLTQFYTAVASPNLFNGAFFTGLTRDDVGGLRYLLRTNNVNKEDGPLGSILISGGFTNSSARQLLTTSNLATLVWASLTNDPGTLLTLFPGLILAGTNTTTFTNVVSTNVFAYFTNFPYSPAGSPASLVVTTNLSTNVEPRFHVTFANVVTNRFYTNGFATTRDTTVSPDPYAPAGSGILVTNVKNSTGIKGFVNGDYFLVPPGLCGYSIVSTQLVTLIPVTNVVTVATNAPGTTNVDGQSFERDIITYFTNYIFVVDPIECGTNGPAFHQGIDKMTFVRRSFDSLLGQFFEPVTNRFQLTMVTNNVAIVQTFDRVINQPDILFSADDLQQPPTDPGPIVSINFVNRSIRFNTNNILAGLPGPGLIEPTMSIIFDKLGTAFLNEGPFFMDEQSNFAFLTWGSFGGTTNDPIVYPSGTSIAAFENQVLMQVTTTSLPGGSAGSPYNAQLQGSGGQTPYSWALVSGQGTLPPGLGLSSDGTISGTPTAGGNFNFTVRMTDSGARSVTRELSITISP
ncbi:MAG: putative Ig domain-containing protein [Verrucomicrobia bacterium]|nr:putative Ig domain-containing protein [Verrucomicrobiota bacterium]